MARKRGPGKGVIPLFWATRPCYAPAMPRKPRVSRGGLVYHVMNRGNNRDAIFHKQADYDAFLKVLSQVREAEPGVRLLGFCLMPNHWHLVLWPKADGQLSRFVQLLSTTHVRRYFAHYHTDSGGHLYQGRFRAFPIQRDDHLLSVLRYVEANPLRAKKADKVKRGRDWKWSSLSARLSGDPLKLLDAWPIDRPGDWEQLVDRPLPEPELEAVRTSVKRGSPFGSPQWVNRTARELGLEYTLRPRGRPPKRKPEPAASAIRPKRRP